MEKNVALTPNEISAIIWALHDKIADTEASFKANGITMSEQARRRLDAMDLLKKKMISLWG